MLTPFLRNASEFDVFFGRLLRRYAFINHVNIEAFAEAFTAHLRARAIPRDPFLILPLLGVRLRRGGLSRASRALWVRTEDAYFIHYSEYEACPSIRFSLWHEVFEILANHGNFPSLLTGCWRERLANRFAACVLMPEWAVLRETKRFATNGEGLAAVLADRFGVSLTAMRRRLRELAPVGWKQGRMGGRPWNLCQERGRMGPMEE